MMQAWQIWMIIGIIKDLVLIYRTDMITPKIKYPKYSPCPMAKRKELRHIARNMPHFTDHLVSNIPLNSNSSTIGAKNTTITKLIRLAKPYRCPSVQIIMVESSNKKAST